MPANSRNGSRRGLSETEKSRRGKLPKKSMSFHGRSTTTIPSPAAGQLRRPMTLPALLSNGEDVRSVAPPPSTTPKLTKLLLNITIQGSIGAVQVVMSPDSTVGYLISAAFHQYVKEGRRPFLLASEPSQLDLHYSQFSLESIHRDEKLKSLESRNFYLCTRRIPAENDGGGYSCATAWCSKEAEKVTSSGFQWLKFMGFRIQQRAP